MGNEKRACGTEGGGGERGETKTEIDRFTEIKENKIGRKRETNRERQRARKREREREPLCLCPWRIGELMYNIRDLWGFPDLRHGKDKALIWC